MFSYYGASGPESNTITCRKKKLGEVVVFYLHEQCRQTDRQTKTYSSQYFDPSQGRSANNRFVFGSLPEPNWTWLLFTFSSHRNLPATPC